MMEAQLNNEFVFLADPVAEWPKNVVSLTRPR
jgi:hypothetical protein